MLVLRILVHEAFWVFWDLLLVLPKKSQTFPMVKSSKASERTGVFFEQFCGGNPNTKSRCYVSDSS